jgi:hypothetical protein
MPISSVLKIIVVLYVNTIRRWMTWWTNNKIQKKMTNEDIFNVKSKIETLKSKIKTTADIIIELQNFRWVSDPIMGIWDYSPTIETFLYHNKKDDCDGAAFYTKYLFELIGGRQITIVSLLSKKPILSKSHVIAIVQDLDQKFYIYSNGYRYKQNFDTIEDCISFYKQENEKTDLKYFDFYVEINY